MEPVIHFVLLDHLLLEPDDLHPFCGRWAGGGDWTTKRIVATCPRCRALIEEEDRARAPALDAGGPGAASPTLRAR